jgi:hypothetical protein
MDEVAPVRSGSATDLRAMVQVPAGAPAADLDRRPRVGDVVDVEAELVRLDAELGHRLGGVDPRVSSRRREPDLVGAARLGADEREAARLARVRDVVEPEAAEAVAARLDAGDREDPVEAGRLHAPDDRLLRPGIRELRCRTAVGKRRYVAGTARVGEVVDADALRGAVARARAAAAREVRVMALPDDVAAVPASRVRVLEHVETRRLRGASSGQRDRRSRQCEQDPQAPRVAG